MNDIIGMTEVKSVCDSQDDLCNLCLIGASVQVFRRIELPSFAIFHDDVEKTRVIVDLINLNDVGMFKLS
jgi:hypothetical protein